MVYSRIHNSFRSLVLRAGVTTTLLAAGCAVDAVDSAPEVGAKSAAATFDWGADCEGGNGLFEAAIPLSDTVEIGEIPPNKAGVEIALRAPADVDVQLVDKATGHEIIAWPNGDLNGPDKACTTYQNVEYCYSGYNGFDSDGDGARELGSEKIEINGNTNRTLVMKAFGYEAGDAEVTYAWSAVNTCNEKGSGEFTQSIPHNDVAVVGDIPSGKVNVFIELAADAGRDVDVQLIDAVDGTEIVAWPSGLMNGPSEQSIEYQGMTITYSGYNGRGGNWGREDIRIDGRVTRPLTMRAFGYQSGVANVTYEWGLGAGDACGSLALPPCGPGLECKNGDDGDIAVDKPGQCHTEFWCESNASAADDCADLVHIAIPGQWACEDFTCKWQPVITGGGEGEMCGGIAGIPCNPGLVCKGMEPDVADAAGTCRAADYCEIMTAEQDCADLIHIAVPGNWGCDENVCAWVPDASVDLVSFDDLRASPVAYADGRIVQVTWSVDAASVCHPCDPIPDHPDACSNPCDPAPAVLGDAPLIPPPLGDGGDFVILGGLQCRGSECDFDRGTWVSAIGRVGLLQGGHIRMQVLRAEEANSCSLADQTCDAGMHCQIGIGCPPEGNCGINPPGMCLED